MDGTPGPDENVGQGHTQGRCQYTSSGSQSHSQSQVDSCAWQEGIDSVHLSHSDSSLELGSPVASSTQVDTCLPPHDHPAVNLSLALNGLDNETGRKLEGNSSVLTSSDRTRNDNDAKEQLAVCNNKIANIGCSNTDILDLSHSDQSNSPRLLRSSCSSGSKVALPSDMIRDTFHPREVVLDQSKINLSEKNQEFTSVKDRDDHQADNSTFESISNSTLLAHCHSRVVSCESTKQDSSQLQNYSVSYSSSDKSVISPSPTNQNPSNRNTQLRLTFSALLSPYSLNTSKNTRPKVQLCTDKTDKKSIECRKDNSKNQSVQINNNNIDMMEVSKTASERIRTENNKSVAAHNESIEADGATDTDNYLSTECRQTHRLETNYNDEHTTTKIKLTEKHLTKAKIKYKTNKVRATESIFEYQPVRIDEQKIAEINEMCKKNWKKIRCEKDKRHARISDNTHLLSFSNESLTDSINCDDATDGNIPNDDNQHECNSGSDKIFVEHSEIEQNCKDCLHNSELYINDNVSPRIHNKVKNELHGPVRNKTAANYGARPWVNEFCNWLKNHEVSGCHSECTLCNQSSRLESQSQLNTLNMGQPDDTISDPNKDSENEAINTVSVDLVSNNNGSETQCRVETFQACTSPIIEQTDEIDVEQESDTQQFRSNNFPCTQEFVPTDRDILQKEPIETQPLETCTQEFVPTDGDILQTQPTGTQPLETCTQEFVPTDGDILQTQPTGTQPFETEIFETQPYDLNTQSPQLSPDSDNSIEVVNASLQNKNITKRTCRLSKNAINKTKHMHVDMKSGLKMQIEVHSHDITSTNAVHTSPKDNSDKVSKQLSGIRRNLDDAFKKHKPINITSRFIEIENKIPSEKTQNAVSGMEIVSLQCDISRKPSQMLEGMTDTCHPNISDSAADSVVNEDAVNDGVHTVKKSKYFKYCENKSSEQNTNTNELRTELMEGMPNLDKEVNNTLKKGNHIDRNSLIRLIDNILGTDYPEKQSSRMIYRVKGISGKPTDKKGQANRVKPIRHSVNKLEEKVSVKYKTLDKEKPCSGGIIMQHDSHHKSLVNQTQKTYEPELLIVDGHSAANKPQVRNAVGSSPDTQYKTEESISKNAETKIIVTSTVATDLDNCSSVSSNTRTQRVGHSAANKQQLENSVSSSHDTQYKTDESTPKTPESKVFVTPTVATQLGNCSSAGSNAPTQRVGIDGLVQEFVNGCPRFKRNQNCESEKQREQCKQVTLHNSDKGTLETVQISNKDKPDRDTIVENKSDGIHCLRKRKSNREHVPENCESEILLDFLRSSPTKRRKTDRKSNGYVNDSEACKLFKSDQQQSTSSSSNVSTVGKKINDLMISRVSLSAKTKFTRKDFTEDWVKLHSHTPVTACEKPTSSGKTLDGSKDTCTHHSTHTTSPQDRTRDKAASEISVHEEWDAFLSRLKPQHPTTGERLRTVKLPSRLEKLIEKLTRIQKT